MVVLRVPRSAFFGSHSGAPILPATDDVTADEDGDLDVTIANSGGDGVPSLFGDVPLGLYAERSGSDVRIRGTVGEYTHPFQVRWTRPTLPVTGSVDPDDDTWFACANPATGNDATGYYGPNLAKALRLPFASARSVPVRALSSDHILLVRGQTHTALGDLLGAWGNPVGVADDARLCIYSYGTADQASPLCPGLIIYHDASEFVTWDDLTAFDADYKTNEPSGTPFVTLANSNDITVQDCRGAKDSVVWGHATRCVLRNFWAGYIEVGVACYSDYAIDCTREACTWLRSGWSEDLEPGSGAHNTYGNHTDERWIIRFELSDRSPTEGIMTRGGSSIWAALIGFSHAGPASGYGVHPEIHGANDWQYIGVYGTLHGTGGHAGFRCNAPGPGSVVRRCFAMMSDQVNNASAFVVAGTSGLHCSGVTIEENVAHLWEGFGTDPYENIGITTSPTTDATTHTIRANRLRMVKGLLAYDTYSASFSDGVWFREGATNNWFGQTGVLYSAAGWVATVSNETGGTYGDYALPSPRWFKALMEEVGLGSYSDDRDGDLAAWIAMTDQRILSHRRRYPMEFSAEESLRRMRESLAISESGA